MNRTMLWALTASTAVAGTTYLYGQGTPVQLQPTTPGTQQVGNANISGRIIASSVHVTDATPTGQAIVGSATSTTGANFGGFFRSDSVLGRALYGRASAMTGTTHGVWGQADSPAGRGVTGLAPATVGAATGVWGQAASSAGRGVYGSATSGSGLNYGVLGQTASPAGFGVYSIGKMHATGVISGNGSGLTDVNAELFDGLQTTGHVIQGMNFSTSESSSGVFGRSTGTTGSTYGVRGEVASPGGRGVYGRATSTDGSGIGVNGHSSSSAGIGVLGQATHVSGSNYGGFFETWSIDGIGVYGFASAVNSFPYGVRGRADALNAFGVYAVGQLGASGAKLFRIDHPFDPANKYLLHYATESPTPQNFYVGNVTTDAQGYAWVDLPDYFSEINKNFKYQLTVVDDRDGAGFAMVKVSKKIRDGRFQIRTSAPNVEVSWRVDADRDDLYMRNNPPKDVQDKVGREKGYYQHPEFYGLGREHAIDREIGQNASTPPKPK